MNMMFCCGSALETQLAGTYAAANNTKQNKTSRQQWWLSPAVRCFFIEAE
jgi:hypothetical protein